jgi:hypothetical protein
VLTPRFELVVRGGTVVTPGHQEIADVGVQDGRIAQIGGAMTGQVELGAHGLAGNHAGGRSAARVSHGPAEEAGQPVDGGRILGDQGFRGERGAGTFRA